jgi:hypothetical protein
LANVGVGDAKGHIDLDTLMSRIRTFVLIHGAVTRLEESIASMRFFSQGPLPSREELHDRC